MSTIVTEFSDDAGSIENGAFRGSRYIDSVVMNGVGSVGVDAFRESSVKRVMIATPEKDLVICEGAFADTENLTEFSVRCKNLIIQEGAFSNFSLGPARVKVQTSGQIEIKDESIIPVIVPTRAL